MLPPEERVYYETRPGLFSLYWGRLTLIGLYLALFISVGVVAPPAAIGAAVFAAPAVLWLIVILLQWSHRVYALTDRRILRISGVRGSDFHDAAYTQVRNMTPLPRGIRFDISTQASPIGFAAPARTHAIMWQAITDPPRVYTFLQEAFAYGLHQSQVNAATQTALDQITERTVHCAYCGGLIELAKLDPANPRCPSCSAPVTLGV
jgi:hypothetical protein